MNPLESRCARLQADIEAAMTAQAMSLALVATVLAFVNEARQAARADLAIALLESAVALAPDNATAWQLLGFAYAEEQRMAAAARAFGESARLDPREATVAVALAQSSLDAGFPAVDLFERAARVAPDHLPAVPGWAAALVAEGRATAAESLLVDTLARHPDWLEGHRCLATLRWTRGDSSSFAASYAAACNAQPNNLRLRMTWFGALMQRQDWAGALKIVSDGEALFGKCAEFEVANALVASESGDSVAAEAWFMQYAGLRDDVLQIAHMRHCLRVGRLEQAEGLALELLKRSAAHAVWPYLSTIWRLRGDARAQWLDGAPPPIRTIDLGYSAGQLDELSGALRPLHNTLAPPIEQSVRGGTQTDPERQLMHRTEPEIQALRARVVTAIRDYVDALPAPMAGHPLLGTPRKQILFSGSWSVRLSGGGFHVSHTHPRGWISSALYVSLPSRGQLGAAPAGWISFGMPPQGLGIELPAYLSVEPKPGRLVLFPSTLWHQTLPFDDGERLIVAFDVKRPRY